EQQEQDPELADGVDHGPLRFSTGKEAVLKLGPDCAEHGGPQEHSGGQLTEHGSLANALHELAEQSPAHEQGDDLREEYSGGRGMARHVHFRKEFSSMQWLFDESSIDWGELSRLYRIAPLGDKSPEHLKLAFSNSRYKCAGHRKIILYA